MTDACILTRLGGRFCFRDVESNTLRITEIAHALSNICRFNGHGPFYSVAQHSVAVANLVPNSMKLDALLHDAAEAFIGDVTTPLKRMLPDYRAIEARVEAHIMQVFGVNIHQPEIKEADLRVLAAEKADLMPHDPNPWRELTGIRRDPLEVVPLSPKVAYYEFLKAFDRYGGC